MKLYTYWRSSCSYRVRIALALKGIEVEQVAVHLVKDGGGQNQDDYARVNPMRQVPALELDDGQVLSQSLAILEYLEEAHPAPSILPSGVAERARARALAEMVNAGIQPLQNLSVLGYVKTELGGEPASWARHFIGRGMQALEREASKGTGRYLVGDTPTVADICLVPQMYNYRRFGLDVAEIPRLAAVDANCQKLEAFRRAHPDAQPDAEPQES